MTRLAVVVALMGCGGAQQHEPPSTHGEMLTVPPDLSATSHQPGVWRFRETSINVGPKVPIEAHGVRTDFELRRSGGTAVLTRDSYDLIGGAWKPLPAARLRERLMVMQTGDLMRLTHVGDDAAVVCQSKPYRVHRAAAVASLRCSKADHFDPKASWSGGLEDITAWSCRNESGRASSTWIGLATVDFSDDVDLEMLKVFCSVNTDAPQPDIDLRIFAP